MRLIRLHWWIILAQYKMFNFVKKLVAGPKKMMEFEGNHLDLTHITERIIAMAFPACSTLEKIYRNSISDVADYLNSQYNGNYLIINVSNRTYDYSKFEDKVKDFEWHDHQAPSLTTLIDIGFSMFNFLQSSKDGVVAIHCNHGKGRTGTAIIGFLILIAYMNTAEQCLKFYNSKRFSSDHYGVDQPCQVRYLKFITQLTKQAKIEAKLPFYRLKKITHKGLGAKYHVKITRTRDQQVCLDHVPLQSEVEEKLGINMLFSDVFIQIYRDSMISERKRIARINYNLFFLNREYLEISFSSKNIKLEKNNLEDFDITFHFQFFCLCHLSNYHNTKCQCSLIRTHEQMFWAQAIAEVNECKKVTRKDVEMLVHGKSFTAVENYGLNYQQAQYQITVNLAEKDKPRKQSTPPHRSRNPREHKLYNQMMNYRKSSFYSQIDAFNSNLKEQNSSSGSQKGELELIPTIRKKSSTIGSPQDVQ